MTDNVQEHATDGRHYEGVRETLESIIVALILAFVFRAFIVEAFVIPTGSMAPTLYGAHGTIRCEDCGIEFAYGVKDLADTRRTMPVRPTSKAICPNCRHANANLPINDEYLNRERGDRILVLKWPLDVGLSALEPSRWDVTVFKDPADGATNFIKRLVGLPNEVLMIVDGDVYAAPLHDLSPEVVAELDALRNEKYLLRTEQQYGTLRPAPEWVRDELDQKLKVARKSRAAQDALWFVVYDHDFPPRTLDAGQPRWVSGAGSESGWDATTRHVSFTDRGRSEDFIELAGEPIQANCAYNIFDRSPPPVADLRVRFVLTPRETNGVVHIRLEKHARVFWASVRMDGRITMSESIEVPDASARVLATKQLDPFEPDHAVKISFENVDYRLAVHVADREVLSSSDDPNTPAFYAPDLSLLRHARSTWTVAPRIYGADGAFALSHLVVDRDEYYYHDPRFRALSLAWAPASGWASAGYPMLLREGEYFMLGDNTSASKDSRLWDVIGEHLVQRGDAYQLGTVPRDQVIGRAFFVYWPAGQRLAWLPVPGLNRLGIIPDVGRMRWIR